MANWERRRADTLAAAILTHRRRFPGQGLSNQRLQDVQVLVARAARTVLTTADDLNAHRAQVCDVCRGFTLYPCDVAEGWSDNCALVSANASEFGVI